MISKRAAATIVLIAGPMAVCLLGALKQFDVPTVVFLAAVQFVTGGWLYWRGWQDGM